MSFPAGGVLVDKPAGPTSHDVVGALRKASGIRRVGHSGTLDPFASGLLLVLFGQATRLAEYLIGMDKVYQARVHLGVETETHDPEGAVVAESDQWTGFSVRDIQSAAEAFTGRIAQRPPVYSAKKVDGEAAHRRVRRGEIVELEPVDVEVFEFDVAEMELPEVEMTVHCSSGTYIRSLARDLGRALGTGAHLSALRRTSIGPFDVEGAVQFEAKPNAEALKAALLSPAALLGHLPSVELSPEDAQKMRHGQFLPLPVGLSAQSGLVRAVSDRSLVAVAMVEEGHLKPRKVMAHD